MRRYLLFVGHMNEARGGWNEFVRSFDDLDEAVATGAAACKPPYPHGPWLEVWHVVDLTSESIVAEGYEE